MAGTVGVSMEQFEAYFERADLDRDGRISGAEAVAFFQGSNLPQQVLAQIWTHADQNRAGFLSRPAFYNALKLVTVAQSKRELTPDIVKAALYGPASAKIPAPQINLTTIAARQPTSVAAAPSPQMGNPAQPSSQNFGIRGQAPSSRSFTPQFGPAPSSPGMNQQFRQVQPSGTGVIQQFGQVQPSSTIQPSTTGMNQQFRPVQTSSTGQQFGQVQPSSTSTNSYFGHVQPSSTGTNQQFGQAPFSTNMSQQFIPSQGNQPVRLSFSVPAGAGSHPPQTGSNPVIPSGDSRVGPGLPNSNSEWLGGKTGVASTVPMTQVLNRGASPSIQPVGQNSLDQLSQFSSSASEDPKNLVASGHRSSSAPIFGGDLFSANQSSSQQVSSARQHPAGSLPASSVIVHETSGLQSSAKPDLFDALKSTIVKPSAGVQALQTSSMPNSNQQIPTQVTSSPSSSGAPATMGSPAELSQNSWPKMTRASIQKYAKVFMEVDSDRDGKITGEQARNLFLSWRLPREVLKQVWDLSDQDSDSMLSLREFCVALYLMERYREGRPLPSTLPNSVMFDDTLLSLAGPPVGYGNMGWGPTAGFRPQGSPGAWPSAPASSRPSLQPAVSQFDVSMQFNQQNARGLATDNSHLLSNGEDNSLDTKDQVLTETNEKVENNEEVLLDSREKLEFYRTKMQDLVLYKSRSDNRLNEITERAKGDKTEVELLEKKYQEKYKQVAEVHSKLTIEEASFREIQERKMELHQAIIKMEQGGSADGILQVRADRVQSDLEELLKALTYRCNKQGVQLKSSVLIEVPPGWTPGIPEVAAIWDEDWDKFEDQGFSFDVAVPENVNSKSVQREHSSPTPSFLPDSVLNADAASEKPFSAVDSALETESAYSADESKSPRGSPGRETTDESPSQEYSEKHFRKSSDGDAETHRSFDESTWGNFDNNDVDSVWGFNAKESDHRKDEDKYFFGSNDFGASSDRTDSPGADSTFQKNSPFIFEDSVPGTPVSRADNSPSRFSMDSRDPFSDNFSRYDSFSVQGRSSSPGRENLTRFDSINTTTAFDHSRKFSFDDSDPFGSSGPFKVSSETPKRGSEWSSF